MRRALYILVLILAGEMIFSLPFHTARFFRPTLLEVFGFSNTQLGDAFAIYGITAMLAYFPGGALADHCTGPPSPACWEYPCFTATGASPPSSCFGPP
jgi:predicted MFS family arabinose efflux permease